MTTEESRALNVINRRVADAVIFEKNMINNRFAVLKEKIVLEELKQFEILTDSTDKKVKQLFRLHPISAVNHSDLNSNINLELQRALYNTIVLKDRVFYKELLEKMGTIDPENIYRMCRQESSYFLEYFLSNYSTDKIEQTNLLTLPQIMTSAYWVSSINKQLDNLKILHKYWGNIDIFGDKALFTAIDEEEYVISDYILKQGTKINNIHILVTHIPRRNVSFGIVDPLLICIARQGKLEQMKYLVMNNINLTSVGADGKNAYLTSKYENQNNPEVTAYLKEIMEPYFPKDNWLYLADSGATPKTLTILQKIFEENEKMNGTILLDKQDLYLYTFEDKKYVIFSKHIGEMADHFFGIDIWEDKIIGLDIHYGIGIREIYSSNTSDFLENIKNFI